MIPLTGKAADGAEWWALVPVSKHRGVLQHTRYGERRDGFDMRQEWWTGDFLPDAEVVRSELAGVPRGGGGRAVERES